MGGGICACEGVRGNVVIASDEIRVIRIRSLSTSIMLSLSSIIHSPRFPVYDGPAPTTLSTPSMEFPISTALAFPFTAAVGKRLSALTTLPRGGFLKGPTFTGPRLSDGLLSLFLIRAPRLFDGPATLRVGMPALSLRDSETPLTRSRN